MSFKICHPAFESLLGPTPKIDCLLEKDYAFAHEAGVVIAGSNELFITSNRLIDGYGNQRVQISRVIVGDAKDATTCEEIRCENVAMANGGASHQDGIVFCAQGSETAPSGLFQTSILPPYEAQRLVSDFHGRPFNSVNDVVVHRDGSLWFTDPCYGYEQGYRPRPQLPSQVYRFQPTDGSIRAMADGFGHPNGICFSPGEKIVYVTDTDQVSGDGSIDATKASTM